jgi:hypothetical protein
MPSPLEARVPARLSRLDESVDDTLFVELRLDGVGQRLTRIVRREHDVFLPTDVVGELVGRESLAGAPPLASIAELQARLRTPVSFDIADLVVTIAPTPEMPGVRRRARERERASLLAESASRPPDQIAPAASGLLALDYRVFGASAIASRPSYDGRAVLGVAGGELSATFSSGTGRSGTLAWTLVRPGAPLVSRLQVGATESGTATAPRRIRGISLGNAPPVRPFVVDLRSLAGSLPDGWTVDAYQGGRFVAFDSVGPDGRYVFALPVGYGQNVVDIVAYGPLGERVVSQEYVRYEPGTLGRGRSEYGVSLGHCADGACQEAGHVSGRIGLLAGLTAEGGILFERTRSDVQRFNPYGSLVAMLGTDVGVEIDADRRSVRRLNARYEPSPLSGVEANWLDAVRESAGMGVPASPRSLRLDAWGSLSARPGAAEIRAQLRYTPDSLAPRREFTLGTSHRLAGLHLRPYATSRLVRGRTPSGWSGLEVLIPASSSWPSWLRGAWFRSLLEVDHETGRLRRTEATLSRQVTPDLRLETEAGWSRDQRGPTVAVRMVTHSRTVRATARSQSRSGAALDSWDYSVGGSLVVDPRARRLTLSSEPSFDRAGISVRAFLDRNVDGVRQDDEPPVAHAAVSVGGRVLATDAHGRADWWGVPAFEPILVRVDSQSVPPHWLVPSPSTVVLKGAQSARLDLAFTPGTTLEGQVQGDGVDASRISLVLRDEKSGAMTPVELFGDGSFYAMSLRPGMYTMSVQHKGEPVESAQRVPLVIPVPERGTDGVRIVKLTVRLPAPFQRSSNPP